MSYMPLNTAMAAGWYADPTNASVQRWWDGFQWTSHTQPVVSSAPTATRPVPTPTGGPADLPGPIPAQGPHDGTPVPGYPAARFQPQPFAPQPLYRAKKKNGLYNAEVDLANGKNSPATNALITGIICLVVNFLLLPSIAAIVWGGIGLSRANMYENRGYPPIGRTKAVWGMCLGAVGLIASVIIKGLMF